MMKMMSNRIFTKKREFLEADETHKLILFWGQFFVLVFFFLTSLGNGVIISVIFLTLARVSYGISSNSYFVIAIDVAGQYAGFLQSLVLMCRSLTYFLNPVLIGFMIQNHTQAEWNLYFVVVGFLTMYGVIAFIIFGSGDLQPWAMNVRTEDTTSQNKNDIPMHNVVLAYTKPEP